MTINCISPLLRKTFSYVISWEHEWVLMQTQWTIILVNKPSDLLEGKKQKYGSLFIEFVKKMFFDNKIYSLLYCLFTQPVVCRLSHSDGSSDEIHLSHSMNDLQISWFQAGSALNRMREMKQ